MTKRGRIKHPLSENRKRTAERTNTTTTSSVATKEPFYFLCAIFQMNYRGKAISAIGEITSTQGEKGKAMNWQFSFALSSLPSLSFHFPFANCMSKKLSDYTNPLASPARKRRSRPPFLKERRMSCGGGGWGETRGPSMVRWLGGC